MPCPAIDLGLIEPFLVLFIAFASRQFKANGNALEAQACWMGRNYI